MSKKKSSNSSDTAKSKANPFDLTKITKIEKDQEVKRHAATTSAQGREALLKNYTEVPKEEWADIKINEHIRYMRKDGRFRKGGYVKAHWIGTTGDKNGKPCIQLINKLTHFNATAWVICDHEIAQIWIRNDGAEKKISSPKASSANTVNNDNIEFLTNQISQLKLEVVRLSNEQKRIINLIRKLHSLGSK